MKFPRNIRADTVTAFEMYHSLTDFNLSDIAKLFHCGKSSAAKIKKITLAAMEEKGVKLYTEDRGVVDKDVLTDPTKCLKASVKTVMWEACNENKKRV